MALLPMEQGSVVVEDRREQETLRASNALMNMDLALVERFELVILLSGTIEAAQMIETGKNQGVDGIQRLFTQGESAQEEGLGLYALPFLCAKSSQVGPTGCYGRVPGAICLLMDSKRSLEGQFGHLVITLLYIVVSQDIQTGNDLQT